MTDDREFWRSEEGQRLNAEFKALWDAANAAKREVAAIKRKPGALWIEVRDAERKWLRLKARYDRRISDEFPPGS